MHAHIYVPQLSSEDYNNPFSQCACGSIEMQPSDQQQKYLKEGCPECGGSMHTVPNTEDTELYLWCDDCDVSMDSDGGYTN